MLGAIAAAKRKNDRIDAAKVADCLRATFFPSATWLRRRFAIAGGFSATAT